MNVFGNSPDSTDPVTHGDNLAKWKEAKDWTQGWLDEWNKKCPCDKCPKSEAK